MRIASDQYVPSMARSLLGSNYIQNGLTDGFPILIVNQKSLNELNRRLELKGKNPIKMNRFRPNIVIDDSDKDNNTNALEPFEEDTWKVIRINDQVFHIVKGCPRCKQSCTDQKTGQVYEEPLLTLAEFRSTGPIKNNLYFGQNAIPHPGASNTTSTIQVGSEVEVLVRGKPTWDRK